MRNAGVPTVHEIARIAALRDPVLRNLEITWCYSRLSAAMAERTGACSNWCTFATWASRQAGATIRGEDLIDRLHRRLRRTSEILHPIQSLWRALLRRGVFRPHTRLGRIVRAVHTPFDAFERTSDAVARGNLKVFQEIGHEFARYMAAVPGGGPRHDEAFAAFLEGLSAGDPPDGQDSLRRAFTRYHEQQGELDPSRRAELIALANLEIGLHEQTRLQPEIRESLDAPLSTARSLGRDVLDVILPRRGVLRAIAGRGPVSAAMLAAARRVRRTSERISREVITECLMVLAMPDGGAVSLGGSTAGLTARPLDAPIPERFRTPSHPEFRTLAARFERCAFQAPPGAEDWADLEERMHFILHLFCACHERADLFSPPFSDLQLEAIRDGRVPEGGI